MARLAARTTRPRPPAPDCLGGTAMDMSATPSTTGGTNSAQEAAESPKSASMNSSSRAGPSE